MEEKEGEVIISLSFGQGRQGAPGLSNEALARVVAELDEKYDLPIVAQWEIANCVSGRMKDPWDLAIGQHRREGQYLDTFEVLAQAKIHCDKFGFNKAIIVAHPDHASRVLLMAEKIGFAALAADAKDVPYDPDSIQEWTKSRNNFLGWNDFAARIFPKLGVPLKDTQTGGGVKTSLIGAAVSGDLNSDKTNDYAFAFYQESAAGKFYYLIAGIVNPADSLIVETPEFFLGTGIDFKSVKIENNEIITEISNDCRKFKVDANVLKEINGEKAD